MAKLEYSSVHRFHDSVAVYIGTGETVYLEPSQARVLAKALNACARDIKKTSYQQSDFHTVRLEK